MKKSKFLITILVAVTISLGCICNVSAQSAPDLKTYAEKLPDTVVRNATDVSTFKHQNTTPVVSDWHSDEYQLYCSDRTIDTVGNDTLTKGNRMDYGIAYLLMNTYPNKPLIMNSEKKIYAYLATDKDGTNPEGSSQYLTEVFATQYAIWGYQGTLKYEDLGTTHLSYSHDDQTEYELYYYPKNDTNIVSEQVIWKGAGIDSLISKAKEAAKNDPANSTLLVTGGDNWTKTDDGYKSSLITVTPSNSEAVWKAGYSLTLEDAPDGVKVYTEAGEDVTNKLDSLAVGTKVYVFVPSEQAKKGPKFTLKASTTITYNAAYQYVDKVNNPPHQPSVLVGPETKNIEGTISLNVIPDTASSISNSIYFVGVLILLCGAGIIYANVKPKKQTNE